MEYFRIRYFKNPDYTNRCLKLIKPLRRALDRKIPKRTLNKTLIFGSWNIREFDGNSKKFGPRKDDAFIYIAEIISRFDIIAIQEINEDLAPLKKVLNILGDNYKYIVTDVAAWKAGGNNERLGFIYDKRTVHFKGIAGELVLPQNMLIRNNQGVIERQFSRTPFKCSFQSGWFKFKVTTVHIYYGAESETSNKFVRRVDEIDKVAKLISNNAKKEGEIGNQKHNWNNPYNYFIVGDFNIVDENNETYDALAKYGFKTIKNRKGSNRSRTKFYDQISYYKTASLDFEWSDSHEETSRDHNNIDRVFDFFKVIYTKAQFPLFKKDIIDYVTKQRNNFSNEIEKMEQKLTEINQDLLDQNISNSKRKKLEERKTKTLANISFNQNLINLEEDALQTFYLDSDWSTFQVSDHLPLWVEINIDKSEEYLSKFAD